MDEVFMEEVELTPSLSEESFMDPQTLVKEARHKDGILKAVSGSLVAPLVSSIL